MDQKIERFWSDKAGFAGWRLGFFVRFFVVYVVLLIAMNALGAFVAPEVFQQPFSSLSGGDLGAPATHRAVSFTMRYVVGPLATAAFFAWFTARAMRKSLERPLDASTIALVPLEDGETITGWCPGVVPGVLARVQLLTRRRTRGAARAALVITDRRLVRLEWTMTGTRHATIAAREDVLSVDRTVPFGMRFSILAPLLELSGADKAVTITKRDGTTCSFMPPGFQVEPLLEWFEKQGFATGFRNEADGLDAKPMVPEWVERFDPARRTDTWATVIVLLVLFLGGPIALVLLARGTDRPYSVLNPGGYRLIARRPGGFDPLLTLYEKMPDGPRVVLATFRTAPGSRGTVFELLTIGGRPFLRMLPQEPPEKSEERFEPLGNGAEADPELVAKAQARLDFLMRASLVELARDPPRLSNVRTLTEDLPGDPGFQIRVHSPVGLPFSNYAVWRGPRGTAPLLSTWEEFSPLPKRGWTIEWEPLGDASDGDDVLLEKAVARLRGGPPSSGK